MLGTQRENPLAGSCAGWQVSGVSSREWVDRLARVEFPRPGRYDAEWVLDNHMGPNPLWLVESLCRRLDLAPGDMALDLGCGKALTSIFLAREFGVHVVAADLWIPPEDNARRLRGAGVAGQVTPLRAEAHSLPFGDRQFDAVVSVDAYHYFGTSDLYLAEMARLLRPGGQLGIVVPGLRYEPSVLPPPSLEDWWDWDFCSFHSPDWWHRHWAKTGLVTVQGAWWMDRGHEIWLDWARIAVDFARSKGKPPYDREVGLLESDIDQILGFTVVVASVPDADP
jgi:cyclopropane fatty-acyl-phospholipid synthase-like methyltransferase